VAALVFVGPAWAFCPGLTVPIGPAPQSFSVTTGDTVNWTVVGRHPKTQLDVNGTPCSLDVPEMFFGGSFIGSCFFLAPGGIHTRSKVSGPEPQRSPFFRRRCR